MRCYLWVQFSQLLLGPVIACYQSPPSLFLVLPSWPMPKTSVMGLKVQASIHFGHSHQPTTLAQCSLTAPLRTAERNLSRYLRPAMAKFRISDTVFNRLFMVPQRFTSTTLLPRTSDTNSCG